MRIQVLAAALGGLAMAGAALAQGVANPRDAAERMAAAVAAHDAAAIAALYADESVLLSPGTAVVAGQQAVRQAWEAAFAAGQTGLVFTDVRTERGGDRAAVVWTWEATYAGASGQQVFRGRSLVYFVAAPGGWLISADMWQPGP